MSFDIRILNIVALILGTGLALFGVSALTSDDPDKFESVAVLIGLTSGLIANWWLFYSRFRRRFSTTKSLGQIAAGIIVVCLISIQIFEWNDVAVLFTVLGILIFAEGFLFGFNEICRFCPAWLGRCILTSAQVIGGAIVFIGVTWLPHLAGPMFGAISDAFLLSVNGFAIFAFIRYRQGRQDELAQVLAATVARDISLVRSVRSYLDSQPTPGRLWSEFVWAAPFFALPLYGYMRLCVGMRSFDQLVEDLADRLDSGEPLSIALRKVGGVATREVRLAAAVGEATNSLETCLRDAERERWSGAWLEVVPRLMYPLMVFLFVAAVAAFLVIRVLPKFTVIFVEFGEPLPRVTQELLDISNFSFDYWPYLLLAALVGWTAVTMIIANPTVRWHTPILGRLYRWGMQATILRTLGRLLAAGRTVPQALEFLRDSDDLPSVVKRRLAIALNGVERGDTLDDALLRAELLPSATGPLVRTAERVRTLPWALGELGDHLAGRAFRLVRRISLIVSPMLVVAIGAVVGFIALGMFMPLIHLLTRLSE